MAFASTYTTEPKKPANGTQSGTKILYSFILLHFMVKGLGTFNPRDVCGNQWPNWKCTGSQHARGAAGDCGVQIVRPGGHPEGHRLVAWLIANHLALGIQEVIFAGRRWTNQTRSWAPYNGRSDHFDHVHWTQNAEGAAGLTLEMLEALWAAHPAPTDPMEDDWMGDPYSRTEVVTPLTEIVGNTRSTNAAVARLEVALTDPKSGIGKLLADLLEQDGVNEAELGEVIAKHLGTLGDKDVQRIARAAADEHDRRERARLGDG